VLVPVLANWVRAYMIVMLGHFSGNTLAVGVDHLVYGWVFFGIVIGLMFMLGARWSEPDTEPPVADLGAKLVADTAVLPRAWLSAGVVAVLALGTNVAAWQLSQASGRPVADVQLPKTLGAGWQQASADVSSWVPAYKGVRSSQARSYEWASKAVGVWAGYYRDQGYTNKLVTSTNFLVAPSDVRWGMVAGGTVAVTVGQSVYKLRSTVVRASADVGATAAQRLLVWHVYWIGGHFTASDAQAKLLLALNRLRGQGDDAAALMFYTPLGNDPEAAADTLRQMVSGQLPEFDRALRATQGHVAPAQ
jgi:EpsI family protein